MMTGNLTHKIQANPAIDFDESSYDRLKKH
jgi:hypothetical protein